MSLERRPSGERPTGGTASPTRALILATISFTVSFAAWGLVGGLASDDAVVSPAAAVSAAGLALNVGLLKCLGRIERRAGA